jgi:hypothetical protein
VQSAESVRTAWATQQKQEPWCLIAEIVVEVIGEETLARFLEDGDAAADGQ